MPSIYHYFPSITRRDAIGYSLSYLYKSMLRAGYPLFLVCDAEMVHTAPPLLPSGSTRLSD
jgi:hypothetical protein